MIDLRIKNVGKGPAKDIEVEFSLIEFPNVRKKWTQQLLTPDDSQSFWFPVNGTQLPVITFFEGKQTTLVTKISYKDVLDNAFTNEQTIDVTSFAKQFNNIHALYPSEPLSKMLEYIRLMSSDVSKLVDTIGNARGDLVDFVNQQRIYSATNGVMKIVKSRSLLETHKKEHLVRLIETLAVKLSDRSKDIKRVKNILQEIDGIDTETYYMLFDFIPSLKFFAEE